MIGYMAGLEGGWMDLYGDGSLAAWMGWLIYGGMAIYVDGWMNGHV